MRNAQKFIEFIHHRGEHQQVLNRIYPNLLNRELFLIAYGNIYANKGATTAGVDPRDTIDGMSLEKIDDIIEKLKTRTYQWKPARRTYIRKKSGKLRPLGMSSWSDKLVQEVIRMVLAAYYEPQFSNRSHGFRPNRGCHTALEEIERQWRGTKWFIEGDIHACFDKINHDKLVAIIAKKIWDKSFLNLIQAMLKAGYMEDWQYYQTYSGTPQGNIASPILANIFLNELDQYVEKELIPKHTRGEKRRLNPAYLRIWNSRAIAKKNKDAKLHQELTKQLRQIPSIITSGDEYARLRYIRYADDVLLGFTGTKQEVSEIKDEIKEYLSTIGLEMSAEKTLITHATTEKAEFLGYEIDVRQADDKITLRSKADPKKGKRRAINGAIRLRMPLKVIKKWKKKVSKGGKPHQRAELLNCSDFEIISIYGTEFRGLYNYYALAQNVSLLYDVKRYYEQSLVKTLACKHKTKMTTIYRKYRKTSDQGVKAIILKIANPHHPNKPLRAQFGEIPLRHKPTHFIIDDTTHFQIYTHRTELVTRLQADKCELCGKTGNVQVHHIRAVKDIRKKYQGRKDPPKWVKFMMERNRKTIIVCRECHHRIHTGKYDGRRVGMGQEILESRIMGNY
jgi:group II intron reverse transcriptase/maturase